VHLREGFILATYLQYYHNSSAKTVVMTLCIPRKSAYVQALKSSETARFIEHSTRNMLPPPPSKYRVAMPLQLS
jgi:hypothetical protein